MTPPPVDRHAESTAGDAHRSLPTPFLTKTYQLVEDQAIDDIISWNEDGSAFIVWNPTEFARDLLPKYFKHNNFSSFVRQLNTYGFRKLVPDRWEFSNDFFKRGEKKLLCDIQRRKIAAAVTASTSPVAVAAPVNIPLPQAVRIASPSASGEEQVFSSSNSPAAHEFSVDGTDLAGENERLRKENSQLNKELTQMKSLCNNIYVLMSGYSGEKTNSSSTDQQGDSCKSDLVKNTVKQPLDLLPMNSSADMEVAVEVRGAGEESSIRSAAEELGARLFGVPIGTKRGREGEGTSADQDMDLQLQQPGGDVKSETSDDADDRDASCLIRINARNQRPCN